MKLKVFSGAAMMLVGFGMSTYGLDHYSASDPDIMNWVFSDGGMLIVFAGLVMILLVLNKIDA